jgi:hypothetical protein
MIQLCNDNTFVPKQLIEKQLSVGKEVHLQFIDLKKAYDNIPSIKLSRALEETRINYTLIKTVKELYRKSVSYIKWGGLLSEGFEVTKGLHKGCCILPTLFKGLHQGCCISPTPFKIYAEKALRYLEEKMLWYGI